MHIHGIAERRRLATTIVPGVLQVGLPSGLDGSSSSPRSSVCPSSSCGAQMRDSSPAGKWAGSTVEVGPGSPRPPFDGLADGSGPGRHSFRVHGVDG